MLEKIENKFEYTLTVDRVKETLNEKTKGYNEILVSVEPIENSSTPLDLPRSPHGKYTSLPKLELKELPKHHKNIFLGEGDTYPVIISSTLVPTQEEKIVR